MDKLGIWERREKTDPRHLKKVNVRGGFLSIDQQYQVKMATEEFGPHGIGWGVRDSKYGCINDKDGQPAISTLEAVFWFKVDGELGEFDISTDIEMRTKYGWMDDHRKKLLTDLITKSLSRLGFNADVFFGLHDGNKYIGKDAPAPAPPAENFDDGILKVRTLFKEAKSPDDLTKRGKRKAVRDFLSGDDGTRGTAVKALFDKRMEDFAGFDNMLIDAYLAIEDMTDPAAINALVSKIKDDSAMYKHPGCPKDVDGGPDFTKLFDAGDKRIAALKAGA